MDTNLMTFVRHYHLRTAKGKEDELLLSLRRLANQLAGVDGFERAELLVASDDSEKLIFVERWASQKAHEESASKISKETFQSIMINTTDRPQVSTLRAVALDKAS